MTCLSFEPASLMAIAPTLQKLVVSNNRLDDGAIEPFVVLQSLTALDLRSNQLCSLGRLQQLLLRLPCLTSLQLVPNPLCEAPKLRERLIVASHQLTDVDGRQIKATERTFLQSLAARQGASEAREGTSTGGSGGGGNSRQSSASHNRGRPQQLGVSIPSAQSFDLGPRAGLLLGEPPAGFYEDAHQPISLTLNHGSRRPWARDPSAA